MPIIVIGADTLIGDQIMDALGEREGEIRAFVTDVASGLALKSAGVKVAIGDVSDASHVGGAAMRCFSAILIAAAAADDRERSFADDPAAVATGWVEAMNDGAVRRVIVVGDSAVPEAADILEGCAPEYAYIAPSAIDAAAEAVRLDDLAVLDR